MNSHMRLSDKHHPALVLSGGGVKAAAFHIGVCLALEEKGFSFHGGLGPKDRETPTPMKFKTYVGSSAGSVISAFLACGYSLEEIISAFTRGSDFYEKFQKKKTPTKKAGDRLKPLSYRDIFSLNIQTTHPKKLISNIFNKRMLSGGLETLIKQSFTVNGIFSTKNVERYLRENVCPDNNFKSLSSDLYIVATQLNHSRKVVFGPFDETEKEKDIKYADFAKISEAVAASASLPPFFAPYSIPNPNGKNIFYFDGEIRDTLSTHVAADHGSDLVIASYSIQPYHFNEKMGSLHEYGMPLIFNQALYQVVQQKIEKHIKHQQNMKSMIKTVQGYLREIQVDSEHIQKLTEILENKTQFNPNVEYIYIHPSPQDYEFFFADHFSLKPSILMNIVRAGFKAAMDALRPYS